MDYENDFENDFENDLTKNDLNFNEKGLLPAILQDYKSGKVLMLAYMNEKAFEKSIESGKATFWSRSREKLWIKGESSGNYQYIKNIKVDCDQDTLLLLVSPEGPACHTGKRSCFYRSLGKSQAFYNKLYQIIVDRKEMPKMNSYTSTMLKKGIDRIGKKVIEEAGEVVIAGKNEDKEEIIYETADLIYHLFILLVLYNISLEDIDSELKERHK